tara:strand:+ start:65 stop:907 length:843 start_codon:yes stop_codon:yes gene_type:complete
MKIFITGATGFIGSHLMNFLVQSDNEIIALCRNNSKCKVPIIKEPFWLNKEISKVTLNDLRGVDALVHLATAGVSPQCATWNELTDININSSIKLIEMAKNAGVKRFIASGTCMEYGTSHSYERIPPSAPLNPNNPYAASKVAGFQLINSFAIQENIELFYGRIFTAYGDGQFSKNLWPSLKNAAVQNKDFELQKGNDIRDFIPVKDVALHFFKALFRDDIQIKKPKIVNVGTGEAKSIYKFASEEWNRFNSKGKLKLIKKENQENVCNKMVADIRDLNF